MSTAPRKSALILRPGRFPAMLIVAALLGMAAVGCRSGDGDSEKSPGPTIVRPVPAGEPRMLAIGFSTLPAEDTTESYIQAFATAAQYGDIVLIQRAPPWEDFFPNRQPSSETLETTQLETSLLEQYEHLKLIYAIDPTDPAVQRARPVDLPPAVSQQEGFLNEDLRTAFVAYVRYVVKNYEPDYLALGVEVNMLRRRSPEQFEAFVSLYTEAYANAKDANPGTKVFPTFQLEDLEGSLGDVHPPEWEALDPFIGMMDALAISTYPYLGEIRTAADLRPDYYAQLRARFAGEILVVESGYASAPVEGERLVGTEADQEAFLRRLLGDAEENGFSAVIWRAALNPTFAGQGAAAAFKDIGLRQGDGGNKAGWATWEEWARRPLQAP